MNVPVYNSLAFTIQNGCNALNNHQVSLNNIILLPAIPAFHIHIFIVYHVPKHQHLSTSEF